MIVKMNQLNTKSAGFTIVELLIVIVVIGILAAITIVSFNGIQSRARDTARVSDMRAIGKSIEVYKTFNGSLPPRGPSSSWAPSNELPSAYISDLAGSGKVMSSLPNDPINDATYRYQYYVYGAGAHGCDPSRGIFYVLRIVRMESVPSGSRHPDSPGFTCSNGTVSRDWSSDAGVVVAWVQGGYLN